MLLFVSLPVLYLFLYEIVAKTIIIIQDTIIVHKFRLNKKSFMILGFIFNRNKHPYKDSPNAAIYERIADQNNSTPDHVYKLAHGKSPKSWDDDAIIRALKNEKIIW